MRGVFLAGRGVVEVGGPEAGALLQRLFTNDVTDLAPGEARYAALLTPQGKMLVDFLVRAQAAARMRSFLLDCPARLRPNSPRNSRCTGCGPR